MNAECVCRGEGGNRQQGKIETRDEDESRELT